MLTGKVLDGRYKILEKIGQGGMAQVYKGLDTLLNRFVAIKVLHEQLTGDQEFVRRFRREAQAAASLSHPHIVNIYDVGEANGIYYIVMEYVDGLTLKDIIYERQKLPVPEAVEITRQICEALTHAHQHKVIHRDIKPPNILITRNGRVKVTDFGIARAASMATVTHENSVIGSVHYISPEQARGFHAGEQSDLYSLGIVFYEMLTGKLPFSGDSPISIALKHLEGDILPPGQLVALPGPVECMVMKAVQKEPGQRYYNAQEFLDDLVLWQKEGKVKALAVDNLQIPTRKMNSFKGDNYTINKKKKKKTILRRWSTAGIVFLFLVTIFAGGVIAFNNFMRDPEVKVPSVEGKSIKEAGQELTDAGLSFEIQTEVHDDQVPAGYVISQEPLGGKLVRKGRLIELTLSLGPQRIPVPDLTNCTKLEASLKLEEAGFEVIVHEEYNETVPRDNVIRQNPGKDFMLNKGDRVEIFVSLGGKPFRLGNFMGCAIDDVRKWLELHNLRIRYIDPQESTEPAGIVIGQYPEPMQLVQSGDQVDLTISKGSGTEEDHGSDNPLEHEDHNGNQSELRN